ncbi:MAG: F0F1 ATP synthase subunit gamma, partial [Anaerolineales bacterium]
MASAREMRLRIRSVKNIAQVTRALEAVSASKVRKAMAALMATRPYAMKAWQVLTHLAGQPGRESLHPLLTPRPAPQQVLVVVISGDRGLAGAFSSQSIREANELRTRLEDEGREVVIYVVGR